MFSLFTRVKKFIFILFSLLVCLGAMILVSLYGEKQYQVHCQELGLKCEKGQVHEMKDSFYLWLSKTFSEIKKSSNLK